MKTVYSVVIHGTFQRGLKYILFLCVVHLILGSKLAFLKGEKKRASGNRAEALTISFHAISFRFFVWVNVLFRSPAIKVGRSDRFSGYPSAWKEQEISEKVFVFISEASGLHFLSSVFKCRNWSKIQVPRSVWSFQSWLQKV